MTSSVSVEKRCKHVKWLVLSQPIPFPLSARVVVSRFAPSQSLVTTFIRAFVSLLCHRGPGVRER
jgi:hypothetical protein